MIRIFVTVVAAMVLYVPTASALDVQFQMRNLSPRNLARTLDKGDSLTGKAEAIVEIFDGETKWQGEVMRILITGATGGIGEATALSLGKAGHHVIVHGRAEERCAAIAQEIEAGGGSVSTEVSNFGSMTEVAAMARRLKAQPLDVIVNNAGVWLNERRETQDGYEATWQINHLAPFLLTTMLLRHLHKQREARVINVSSSGHRAGEIAFDDVNLKSGFSGIRAYCQSKLANVLFTQELARRTEGSSLVTHAFHPGAVKTKLLAATGFSPRTISPVESAAACVALAVGPEAGSSSGDYWADGKRTAAATTDAALGKRLWVLSEQQVATWG